MLCLQPPAPYVLHSLFNGGKDLDETDRRQARVQTTYCDFILPTTLTENLLITLISVYLLSVLFVSCVYQKKKIQKGSTHSHAGPSLMLVTTDLALAQLVQIIIIIKKEFITFITMFYHLFKQKAVQNVKRQKLNVQGSDSCWAGGTSASLAGWRYLHAQRFSEGKRFLLPLLPVK